MGAASFTTFMRAIASSPYGGIVTGAGGVIRVFVLGGVGRASRGGDSVRNAER